MAILIPALTTGAGVNTSVTGLPQVECNIVVGGIDTAMPLQGFKVLIANKTTIDIQGSIPLVSTFAKFMNRIVASTVGLVLQIATGRIIQNGCSLIFTNGGATTPAVYWFSDTGVKGDGTPVQGVTVTINPNTNQTFTRFAGLFITPLANISSFDVVFADGTSQNMTYFEANALFSQKNDTQAGGQLDAAVTGFDNRDLSIVSVRVNANGTAGGVTVLVVS